jgi:hypothetical protein
MEPVRTVNVLVVYEMYISFILSDLVTSAAASLKTRDNVPVRSTGRVILFCVAICTIFYVSA